MHYTYDPQADALYIYLREEVQVAKTVPIDEGRLVDVDNQGVPIGIEILGASHGVELQDVVERFSLNDYQDFLDAVTTTKFRPVLTAGS